MSNENTTNTKPQGNTPSHIVYQVRERKGQKAYFSRIGCAWQNADGQGFNIQLDAVPLDGRLTLRVYTESKE